MSTRQVKAGGLAIGGGAQVSVQSMTNTDTRDVAATLAQIATLREAGCDIVRCSVYDMDCARAMRPIVEGAGIPVVADVHFDYRLGIAAVENGVSKLRINPGNIGGEARVEAVARCCLRHGVPIRVGVNSGSVEPQLLRKYGGPTPQAMVESAQGHIAMLEKHGFTDIVVSMKTPDVPETVAACQAFAKASDYPQHIGITESGTVRTGLVRSAVGIGSLLMQGIGDTLRVSLSGDPLPEIEAGLLILRACGLRNEGVRIVSCPTCGRTGVNVAAMADELEARLAHIKTPLRIAVMGCVVNGPGEAREADLGIAGGPEGGVLFVKGQKPRKVPTEHLMDELLAEINKYTMHKGGDKDDGNIMG